MNSSNYKRTLSQKHILILLIFILLGVLFFGLRPRDLSLANNVTWSPDQPGLRFNKYCIAYTAPTIEFTKAEMPDTNAFSIDIALKLERTEEKSFDFIWSLHNGEDRDQLLMAQWHSWIILMNGDDYSSERKTKRITMNTQTLPLDVQFFTITTGQGETNIYINGRRVRSKKQFTLKMPQGDPSRLTLGNSVYGKHSWKGNICAFAFYGRELTAEDASDHFNTWKNSGFISSINKRKPLLQYLFDEKEVIGMVAQGNEHYPLQIPSRMKVPERKILSPPWNELRFNKHSFYDIFINFTGFIPFGFVLAAALHGLGGPFKKHRFLMAVGACFLVSLLIEVLQSWMPSRSSQMLDLILNTLGASVGVIIYNLINVRDYGKMNLRSDGKI